MSDAVEQTSDTVKRTPHTEWWSRAARWRGPLGLALGMVALGAWLGIERAAHPAAVLQIEAEAANFGEQWAASKFPWTVAIRNPSAVPITVQSVRTSCICIKAEPDSFVVPAQGETKLTLLLDLASRIGVTGDPVTYDEEFGLVVGEGLPFVQSFHIQGTVRCPLRIAPNDRLLMPCLPGTVELAIPLTELVPLKSVAARCESADVVPTVAVGTDAEPSPRSAERSPPHALVAEVRPDPAQQHQWTLTLRGAATKRGPFEVIVAFRPVDESGTVLPELRWKFRGRVDSPVQVLPEEVDFGTVEPDAVARETVTLRWRDGRPCVLKETRCPQGITATSEGSTLPSDLRLQIEARYRTSGVQQSTIEIELENANHTLETVLIPVRAYVARDPNTESVAAGAESPTSTDSATPPTTPPRGDLP